MKGEVWVYAESTDRALHEVSLEILSKGREIADKIEGSLSAVLVGRGLTDLGKELIDFGADQVHLLEPQDSNLYPDREMVEVLVEFVKEYDPDIFLLGATSIGTELAPKLAAKLKTGLSAHCIDLDINKEGHLLQIVPAFGGGVLATIVCPDQRPQMATISPGVMRVRKRESPNGKILRREIPLKGEPRIKVLETLREEPMEMPLEKAEVVIAGGWGLGGKEYWQMLEELAALLRGAVGATRPAADEGWAREYQMIGQSGKTVRPKLYMGFGISGMMHHMVGIQDSDFIIAVNSDPEADIFKMCDLGVVGDLKEILPSLTKEIREKLEK
ncbi:MAG: electron transfer flavoprotein subunit alpha/FixB family protein [Desulfobacterales bacterium]|nr:electron transfer flavoprotein subunit alpha/FixB family protein [Desulfobacterales bacterium]